MAKKRSTPKRDWIDTNREAAKADGFKGKALEQELESRWKAHRGPRAATTTRRSRAATEQTPGAPATRQTRSGGKQRQRLAQKIRSRKVKAGSEDPTQDPQADPISNKVVDQEQEVKATKRQAEDGADDDDEPPKRHKSAEEEKSVDLQQAQQDPTETSDLEQQPAPDPPNSEAHEHDKVWTDPNVPDASAERLSATVEDVQEAPDVESAAKSETQEQSVDSSTSLPTTTYANAQMDAPATSPHDDSADEQPVNTEIESEEPPTEIFHFEQDDTSRDPAICAPNIDTVKASATESPQPNDADPSQPFTHAQWPGQSPPKTSAEPEDYFYRAESQLTNDYDEPPSAGQPIPSLEQMMGSYESSDDSSTVQSSFSKPAEDTGYDSLFEDAPPMPSSHLPGLGLSLPSQTSDSTDPVAGTITQNTKTDEPVAGHTTASSTPTQEDPPRFLWTHRG